MKFGFIDEGEWLMDDEPVVVGLFDTEVAAAEAAEGRRLIIVLTPEEWEAQREDDEEYEEGDEE